MNFYQAVGLVSVALTIASFAPYVLDIRKGSMKPHFFSWVIWSLTTAVVFFAQVAADGGPGAWPTGVSAVITLYVTWLAWALHGDITITRADWVFLWCALASLPVWYFTADPLWSVVILTVVDVLGFGPTLRKLYSHPHEESVLFYLLFAIRSVLAIVALESRTVTTVLFPAAMIACCIVVCAMLWWRRKAPVAQP